MHMRENSSMELESAGTGSRDYSFHLRRNGEGMQRGNCRMEGARRPMKDSRHFSAV